MATHLLTSVFMRLRPRLIATAQGISGSENDALDALQDAFCRLWRHRDEITDERHATGALVTSVRNAAIDSVRRRHPESDISAAENTPQEADNDSSELFEEVEKIIADELSERDRRILYLRDRYGYEIDAIAEEFNMTEAAVRMVLSRARRTVRQSYLNHSHSSKI